MGLNIKTREAHDLAWRIAQLTGETLTAAVETALRERLDHLREKKQAPISARLMRIGKECAPRLSVLPENIDDLLYGEDGLPR